jgi:hypothetical protein
VIYQDPLAYLPGPQGIALLDAWPGSGRTADLKPTAVSGMAACQLSLLDHIRR